MEHKNNQFENVLIGKIFEGLSFEEKRAYFVESKAEIKEYQKDEFIFSQYDQAKYLYILIKGEVDICQETSYGNRILITKIQESGDMFGEVYLFLQKEGYDFFALVSKKTQVLQIPKEAFFEKDGISKINSVIRTRMMQVLAQKAYYLNKKIRMMSGITIRQKLSIFLLENMNEDGIVNLSMNREDLASYFSITRPSLSRELSQMREEGIIDIKGKIIKICDRETLEYVR